MPKEHEKIKYLDGEKSLKVPFVIYSDLECLLKKVRSCQNDPENSYTEKKFKSKPSGYAWCLIYSFDDAKNRRYFYRRKIAIKIRKKSEIIAITLENLVEPLIVNAI